MDNPESDPGVRRFMSYLELHGIRPVLIELPTTTHSAKAAAEAVTCDLSQIVKSLLFTGCQTGRAILVLVSGPNRADTQRLSEIVGEKVRLADAEQVLSVTGYPVGAVPPVGLTAEPFTIIDEDLSLQADVWISGGSDHALAKVPYQSLIDLTGGKVTPINRSLAKPIIIMPYDPKWPALYQAERKQIQAAIGQYLKEIEHIGSTAVPGLNAKPIIDIMGGVSTLGDAPAFIPPLEKMGYRYVPEFEMQMPERRYLTRTDEGRVMVHLHLVETSTPFWHNQLAFRDRLISDTNLRDAYGALKTGLSLKFGNDRVGYTDAKSDFIREALNRE
jgi:GrpB-like predicted nucleotidyltransferase (UPF0157 family)/prolyl-tRNA editing enzyme YbaK/EbsC (Cys-tRNA(Pro) deacylase)